MHLTGRFLTHSIGRRSFLLFVLFIITNGYSQSGAAWNDVSEYLLGKVHVKVFLVESNASSPNTENWTQIEKDTIQSVLSSAVLWLQEKYDCTIPNSVTSARPSFTFSYEDVTVSYEPISLKTTVIPVTNQNVPWIQEIMNQKGYTSKTPALYPNMYQFNVAQYCNDLRNLNGSNWTICCFVIDRTADADGNFPNGVLPFMSTSIGGPGFIVGNYRVGDDYNRYIRRIVHEMIHCFHACDEYDNPHFKLDAFTGYLNSQNLNFDVNQNNILDEPNSQECIFRTGAYNAMCTFTKKHIGWVDTDTDGIPDILDVDPQIDTLNFTVHINRTIYCTGKANSIALANNNPYSEGQSIKPPSDLSVALHLVAKSGFTPPFSWAKNNITVNTISIVEYRIKNKENVIQNWTLALPTDGIFDSDSEDFNFTTPVFENDTFIFEVRCKNTAGLLSLISSRTVYMRTTTIQHNANSAKTNFTIFPNPTSGIIQIAINNKGNENTLIINNITGQELIKQKTNDSKIQIDVSNLTSGIYFVKLITDKTVGVKKFLKTKPSP